METWIGIQMWPYLTSVNFWTTSTSCWCLWGHWRSRRRLPLETGKSLSPELWGSFNNYSPNDINNLQNVIYCCIGYVKVWTTQPDTSYQKAQLNWTLMLLSMSTLGLLWALLWVSSIRITYKTISNKIQIFDWLN